MDWLNHPSYARLRDRLIRRLRMRTYQFKTLRPVLFLCGGRESPRRERIADYLRKYHPQKLLFNAEDVWNQIASRTALNALQSERELAQLSDVVLIVVESPGTFAELGAFSLHEALRPKLLLILDDRHRGVESFLNAGPIRWVDAESHYRPSIQADFSVILKAMPEIENRLERIGMRRADEIKEFGDIGSSPKHLLFLLCDLVAMVGPAPEAHCKYYLDHIFDGKVSWSAGDLLSLAVSMKILTRIKLDDSDPLYFRPLKEDSLQAFQSEHMFSVVRERAKFLSVLQGIEGFQKALDAARER